MSITKTLTALLLAAGAASASAAVSYDASAGLFSGQAGAVNISFDSLSLPNNAVVSYTGTIIAAPGNSGYAAEPPGDSTAFYSVGATNGQNPTGSATFGGNGASYFGFYMGSPDTYNSVTLYHGNTVLATVTGSQMAAAASLSPDGNQSNGFYMNLRANGGPSFTKIVFSSIDGNNNAVNAFETDNHAYILANAVPEPEMYAMLLAGLGLIGLMRRRKA